VFDDRSSTPFSGVFIVYTVLIVESGLEIARPTTWKYSLSPSWDVR
jgi:hypothetical protein